jgi:hypothetical protein
VNGTPTHFPDGVYLLRYRREGKRVWENVSRDDYQAQKRQKDRQWQLDNCGTTFATLKTINPDAPAPKATRKTIADSIDIYLKDVAATKAEKTISGYTHDLDRFTKSCTKTYVDEIDKEDLALGSRSLSRNGEGSMALNNRFNSPTCTSMTEHLGGSWSPAEGLSLVPEAFVIGPEYAIVPGSCRSRGQNCPTLFAHLKTQPNAKRQW